MMSFSPPLTNELLRGINVFSSVQVAVTTAALYDHVLALSREVELIWMKPMTLVTALYVIERYLGDVVLIVGLCLCFSVSASEEEYVTGRLLHDKYIAPDPYGILFLGLRLFKFRAWGALAYAWATQATMQLRIYAMYRRSRAILILLLIMFMCEIVAIAFIISRQIGPNSNLQATSEYVFGDRFCSFTGINRGFVYIFVPFVVFEFLLFLLAVRMFVENMRRNVDTYEEKGFGLNTFMRVLARDSLCYFFVNMVASSVVTGIWLGINNPVYANVCIPLVMLLEVLIGTRLILGFRERYARSDADPVVSGKQSSLQFREDASSDVNPTDTILQMESHRMSIICQTETIVVTDNQNLGGAEYGRVRNHRVY